jgi:hypothetical protein
MDASSRIAATANKTLCSLMNGIAEPMFDIAEDIDTATVRM